MARVQQEQLSFDAVPDDDPATLNVARTDGVATGPRAGARSKHPIVSEMLRAHIDPSRIWDGELQAFVPGTLRQAMLVRGFTPDSLCAAAGVAHGTMYNALAGRVTRLRTARRILEALAAVEPAFLLAEMA